jgi:simple sugar transport system permease protein
MLFGTIDTGGIDVDLKLEQINKDIVTVLKALIVLFIAAGGFLSRRVTDPPPPQLLKAVEATGKPDAARLDAPVAKTEQGTPLPNVGLSSENNTREGGK